MLTQRCKGYSEKPADFFDAFLRFAFCVRFCLLFPFAGGLGGHVPFPKRLGQLQGTAPDRLGNRGVAADALDEPFLRRSLRTQEPQSRRAGIPPSTPACMDERPTPWLLPFRKGQHLPRPAADRLD